MCIALIGARISYTIKYCWLSYHFDSNQITGSKNLKMPPAVTSVWKYFKRTNDGKQVKCNLCSTELTYNGRTSNMLNHLRGRHPTESTLSAPSGGKQCSMAMFVNSPRKESARQGKKSRKQLWTWLLKTTCHWMLSREKGHSRQYVRHDPDTGYYTKRRRG